jgi:hypothetical protein
MLSDEAYKTRSGIFRDHRWKKRVARKAGVWTRIKERAVNVTFRTLAKSLVRHFADPDEVFMLSRVGVVRYHVWIF